MSPELTTVADDEVVVHRPATPDAPAQVLLRVGLEPDHAYEIAGLSARTLPRPPGERLATVCTVNDTHIGETVCGAVGGTDGQFPGLSAAPGEPPYAQMMSRAAAAEIADRRPAAVVAKGDLTAAGLPDQLAAFEACYQDIPAGRLYRCLGNHDVANPLTGPPMQQVEVTGLTIAILDTARPGCAGGFLSADQLGWLDEVGRNAAQPVLALGHHPPWDPSSPGRPDDYFGIAPADSEGLVAVVSRRPAILAYAAGHTHRNLVRHFAATGAFPWIEVASAKDFPGTWAEYRVFEGGVLQVHRRISSPEALAWSERCRGLIQGYYPAYAFGSLADRCFPIWPRS